MVHIKKTLKKMTVLDTLQTKHFTWIIYFNPSKEAYKINIY